MRVALGVIALGLGASTTPALARPSYLFIDAKGDGSHAIFVDVNSIAKRGSTRDYWMLQVNLAPTATRPRYVSHILKKYTDDCTASTSLMTYSIMYTGGGEPLARGPVSLPVQPIIPDSIGSEIHDMLCTGEMPGYTLVGSVAEARALGRKLTHK